MTAKNKKISEGIKRYYGSLEWKKRKQENSKESFKKLDKLFQENRWHSTMELCQKFNKQNQKEITLRRMSQLLFTLLGQKLLDTEIKNMGNKGRFRQWKKRTAN